MVSRKLRQLLDSSEVPILTIIDTCRWRQRSNGLKECDMLRGTNNDYVIGFMTFPIWVVSFLFYNSRWYKHDHVETIWFTFCLIPTSPLTKKLALWQSYMYNICMIWWILRIFSTYICIVLLVRGNGKIENSNRRESACDRVPLCLWYSRRGTLVLLALKRKDVTLHMCGIGYLFCMNSQS